jgi:hypothetical protein
MINHKYWTVRRKDHLGAIRHLMREGWFLFGFIPLYTRDC